MQSVLVKVSKFGRFSHAKDNVTILINPSSFMFLFVAARTASSKSYPIPNFYLQFETASAFSCFLKQENTSPAPAITPPIIFILVISYK